MDEFSKAANNVKGELPISKKAKLEKITIGRITYVHLLVCMLRASHSSTHCVNRYGLHLISSQHGVIPMVQTGTR